MSRKGARTNKPHHPLDSTQKHPLYNPKAKQSREKEAQGRTPPRQGAEKGETSREIQPLTSFGRVGIQIVGRPGNVKVIGVAIFPAPLGNGTFQPLLAHIAPGAHDIRDNLNVELGHSAKCGSEEHASLQKS
jgi:hypothetical protein